MKFSSRAEVDASADTVFRELSDFDAIDKLARKRSVIVKRTDSLGRIGVGMTWLVDFRFRGRMRRMEVLLARFDAPETIGYKGTTPGFEVDLEIQLVALSKTRTRIIVSSDIRPRSLGARILMQSARLGKSALDRRFDERIRKMCEHLDDRLANV